MQTLLFYKMLSIKPWSCGVQVHYLSYLYQPGDVLSSVLQSDESYYLYTSLGYYHVHALQLELSTLTEFEASHFILLCLLLCVLLILILLYFIIYFICVSCVLLSVLCVQFCVKLFL